MTEYSTQVPPSPAPVGGWVCFRCMEVIPSWNAYRVHIVNSHPVRTTARVRWVHE